MKQLSYLKSLILTLAIMLGVGNAWAQTYTRLESIASIDETAQYVLGIDEIGFHYATESKWGKVDLPSSQTPLYYTLRRVYNSNGQPNNTQFTAETTIDGTTNYIQVSSSKTFAMSTSKAYLYLYSGDKDAAKYTITDKDNSWKILYNSSNNPPGLRCYSTDVNTSNKAAYFYKVETSKPKITIDQSVLNLLIGEKFDHLTATLSNLDGTPEWTSESPAVASVDKTTGVVTGKAAGTTKITASLNGTVSSNQCNVNVRAPYTITFLDKDLAAYKTLTETSYSGGIVLPNDLPKVGDWTHVGWSTEDFGTSEVTTPKGTILEKGTTYYPTGNITLYPVYTRTEEGDAEPQLAETLQYDTWTYGGSTTKIEAKNDPYRLFHNGGYVESGDLDLSILSKVVVYGGTYGGTSFNKLTIAGIVGSKTTTWKDVTVSGSSQTGTNTYTDGTALTGTGKVRVTSGSGEESKSGVRMTKVEIYTQRATITYYIRRPYSSATDIADADFKWSANSYIATIGATNSFPTLTNTYGVPVTYTCSNSDYADIDASGNVTLKKSTNGSYVTITASFAGNGQYNYKEASYKLYINKGTLGSKLQYSASAFTAYYGADNTFPTLTNSEGVAVTYTSSQTAVATIDDEGTVALVKPSTTTTTIKASFAGNDKWNAAEASYVLTVSKGTPTLEFSRSNAEGYVGVGIKDGAPTLTITPDGLPVTYSSSNTSAATVDGQGEVTLKAAGTTVITASFAGNEYYNAATPATYTLTVKTADIYEKVTSADQLVAGNEYILVAGNTTSANALGTTQNSNNRNAVSVSIEEKDGKETVALTSDDVARLTLGGSAKDGWTIGDKDDDNNPRYLYYGSNGSNNYLKSTTNLSSTENATWDITETFYLLNKKYDDRYIAKNDQQAIFGCYNDKQTLAYLFVKQGSSTDTRKEAGLSWSAPAYTATIDEDNTFPAINNPNKIDLTGKVTYRSSDETVAKIHGTSGTITLVNRGTTTITAEFGGNDDYKPQTITYELKVKRLSQSGYYVKVTEDSDLEDGQYLIVYEDEDEDEDGYEDLAFDGGLEKLDVTGNSIDVEIDYEADPCQIAITDDTEAAEFTIGTIDGGYTIKSASGYYIGTTTDNNNLISSQTVAYVNTISINDDEDADIVSEPGAHLRYNAIANQARFRYYKSASYAGQKAIQLYKKVASGTVTKKDPEARFDPSAYTDQKVGETLTNVVITNSPGSQTYSSNNTDVATVNASTGEVTLVGMGTATITVNIASTVKYNPGTASYTISVTKKGDAKLTVDPAEVTIFNGEQATIYYTSNNHTKAATAASGNTGIATVADGTDDSFIITASSTNTGTCIVTLRQDADDNYEAGTATVTVHVVEESTSTDVVFVKVTDESQLVEGKRYLIVYESGSKAMGSVSSSKGASVGVTINNHTITNPSSSVNILTLGYADIKVGDILYSGWTFVQENGKYIQCYSNKVSTYDTRRYSTTWGISIDDDGYAKIEAVSNTGYQLDYSDDFQMYSNTYDSDVSLYVEEDNLLSGYYYRVSDGSVPEGDYLIVYEDGDKAYDALTHGNASSGLFGPYIKVSIDNEKIRRTSRLEKSLFHISGSGDNYNVQTLARAANVYIGDGSKDDTVDETVGNLLKESAEPYANTASIEAGEFKLQGAAPAPGVGGTTVNRILRFNVDAGYFRYYRFDSGVQNKLALYRPVSSSAKYIQVVPHDIELEVGETVKIEPASVQDARLRLITQNTSSSASYSSDDPSVATVDGEGLIKAISPGRTNIVVTVDGQVNAVNVTVRESEALSRYVKVTDATELTTGEYLIVYETSSSNPTSGKIMDGSLLFTTDAAVSEYGTVTIEKDKILDGKLCIGATEALKARSFAITQNFSNKVMYHNIKSRSGFFIGKQADKDGLDVNAGASFNNLLTLEDGNLLIKGTGSTYLKYNSNGFKFYTSGGQNVQLYKRETYNYNVYKGSATEKTAYLADIEGPVDLGNNEIAVYNISDELAKNTDGQMNLISVVTNVVVNGVAQHLKVSDKDSKVATNNGYADFYAPAEFTKAKRVEYARPSVLAGNYNSVCLPFDLTSENKGQFGEGAKFYTMKELKTDDKGCQTLQFEDNEGDIPAGTPMIVKSPSSSWTIDATLSGDDYFGVAGVLPTPSASGVGLRGSFVTAYLKEDLGEDLDNCYKLASDGKTFKRTPAKARIFPFRIYLVNYASNAPAELGFSILEDDGTETRIEEIDGEPVGGQWYDLSGRRVSRPTRGVYIRDGRRVVVR